MPIQQQVFQQFSHIDLVARQVVEGFITGLHKSPFHGFSVEFAEHRIYNTGESIRHIDWKLFGRTEKLFVKRYEEETNLRCQIVIDCSSSMYYPEQDLKNRKTDGNKITFSVYSAAAILYLLRKQRDAAGLTIFSEKIEIHTQAKSTSAHHKAMTVDLEKLLEPPETRDKKKTCAAEAIHQIADRIHKRSLVIIFSDMMETSQTSTGELFSALKHLRHNNHEVIIFHVVDKSKEEDFQFDNRPYRFVDMETGEEVKVHPKEIKEKYILGLNEYKQELKLRCAQYRIDFVEADIGKGFTQVLWPYLLKRAKMP